MSIALRVVAGRHGLTPVQPGAEHLVHIILRKLFVVPVVFGAVWFGLRDAVTYTTAGWDKRFGLRDPLA